MGPKKLSLKLNGEGYPITFKDARKLYNDYCTEFKTGVDFLRGAGRTAAKQGWIANLNGRRRYWIMPNPDDLAKYPKGREDPAYLGRMGGIEREGGNMLIQSMNAEMTKTAMVMMRDYKKAHGTRTEFCNQVYDEIVTFTHKDDSAEWVETKRRFMREAAHKWMKSVKMETDGHVEPYWTK